MTSDAPAGQSAADEATRRAEVFAARYGKLYPGALACLEDDFASLTAHLRFPRDHWKRIRHSNFIERTFGETRRRVKVIGRLPGETSCLSLAWAVLDRASRGWRGVTHTPTTSRQHRHTHRLTSTPRSLYPKAVYTTAVYTTAETPLKCRVVVY